MTGFLLSRIERGAPGGIRSATVPSWPRLVAHPCPGCLRVTSRPGRSRRTERVVLQEFLANQDTYLPTVNLAMTKAAVTTARAQTLRDAARAIAAVPR